MAEQLQANLVLPRSPKYQVVRFKAHHGLWSVGAVFSGLSNQSGEPVLPKGKVNIGCNVPECFCRRGKVKMLWKSWEVLN